METGIRIFLLRTVFVALAATASVGCSSRLVDTDADQREPVIDPAVERREVKAAEIDSEDFELSIFTGLMSVEDFGSNAVYGARIAYHVTEGIFAEATYGQTDTDETSFEKLSGGAPLLADDDRQFQYYDISLGYNLLPGEVFVGSNWAASSALYFIAGVGNTRFAGDNYFTVNFGAGYRVLTNDWLALHLDVRDRVFSTDLLGEKKTVHNIEFNLGVSIFF